jgi:hypothetical protein
MNENEESHRSLNNDPIQSRKYTYTDMRECWIEGRKNLVEWGIGDGDKPDFHVWIRKNFGTKEDQICKHNGSSQKIFIDDKSGEYWIKCMNCGQEVK